MSAKVADALLLWSTEFSMNKTIQKLKGFSVEPKTHNYGPYQTKTRHTYTSKCHHGLSTSVLDQ
jgi:hypothetical protein